LVDVPGQTKEIVIKKTMQKVAARIGLDSDLIAEFLLDRKALMPTGLNNEIAIPHPLDGVMKNPGSDLVVTVFPQHPIEYGALDEQLVHTLFFLFSFSDKTHLHLLSKLAHLSSQQATLDFSQNKAKHRKIITDD